MTLYRTDGLPEDLVAPVMIAAFDGWVDAASAASSTAEHLARGAEPVATFDADVLFDYRSRRPVLDIIDGTLTRLTWPSLELHRLRAGGRDLLLLHGAEPDFRWRQLGDELLELCLRMGVIQWVSLGAIPAAATHARPTTVLATASADGLLDAAAIQGPPGLLRVPSACLSAIEMAVSGSGLPAVGFYAHVPHYIGGPYADATLALIRSLGRHLQVELPEGTLQEDAKAQRERLDAAVDSDEDLREMLERLQREAEDEQVPSGDELAAEIERFLRTQGGPGQGTIGPG